VVWVLRQGEDLEPVEITLGITDHTYTEVAGVRAGRLAPGDEIVTSFVRSDTASPAVRGLGR
jgi:hypothetical protein